MPQTLTPDQWLARVGKGAAFSAIRAGYTPHDETRVFAWRTVPDHLMYFYTHNGANVAFHDGVARVNKGGFIWIMPNVPHETRLPSLKKPFRVFFLRFAMGRGNAPPLRLEQDWVHREDAWELLPHFRELIQELQSPQMFHAQRVRASLMLLTAGAMSAPVQRQRAVLTAQQRLRLLSYLELHASEQVTPEELAEEVGFSISYFRRIFHRTYGMSVKHWIVQQRVMLAAMILSSTEMKLKEVANQLGYCDPFLLSRQFKQVMGMSPRLYRRGTGGEPPWDARGLNMGNAPAYKAAIARQASKRRPSSQ